MTTTSARRANAVSFDEASQLLRRYPDLSEEERRELIRFIKEGSPDDVARLTFGSGLEDRITAFKKDHPRDFATGAKVLLPLLLFLLGATVLLVLARLLFV